MPARWGLSMDRDNIIPATLKFNDLYNSHYRPLRAMIRVLKKRPSSRSLWCDRKSRDRKEFFTHLLNTLLFNAQQDPGLSISFDPFVSFLLRISLQIWRPLLHERGRIVLIRERKTATGKEELRGRNTIQFYETYSQSFE